VEKLPVVAVFGSNNVKLTLKKQFVTADNAKTGHFVVDLDTVKLQSVAIQFIELKGLICVVKCYDSQT